MQKCCQQHQMHRCRWFIPISEFRRLSYRNWMCSSLGSFPMQLVSKNLVVVVSLLKSNGHDWWREVNGYPWDTIRKDCVSRISLEYHILKRSTSTNPSSVKNMHRRMYRNKRKGWVNPYLLFLLSCVIDYLAKSPSADDPQHFKITALHLQVFRLIYNWLM